MDLDAIAAEEEALRKKAGPRCWMCSLPKRDREWAEKARRDGRSTPVIAATLVRAGHPKNEATRARIENHLNNHTK